MKHTIGAVLGMALFCAPGDRLEVVYEQNSKVECERVREGTRSLTSVRLFLDGEELPAETLQKAIADADATVEKTTIRFRDHFETVRGGEPTRVRRFFEEIACVRERGDAVIEAAGELEGRTLSLERGDRGNAVTATLQGEADESSAPLANFRIRPDEEILLPGQKVTAGHKWSPGRKRLERLLGLSARPEHFAEQAEDPIGELGHLLGRGVDFSAEVTLEGVEEHDGVSCWLLRYELEIEGTREEAHRSLLGLDGSRLGLGKRADLPERGRLVVKGHGAGRVWVSCEERRFVEATQEIEATLTLVLERTSGELALQIAFGFELDVEDRARWRRR